MACCCWLRLAKRTLHIRGTNMQAAIRHDDTREPVADAEIVHCNAVHADSSTYTCLLGFAGNGNMASSIPLVIQKPCIWSYCSFKTSAWSTLALFRLCTNAWRHQQRHSHSH
jgi:hypothetical protein